VLGPQSVPRSLYLEDAEINLVMTPTIFREGGFRFYFFSREEPRMHVHVHCADGEAKFWLEPTIELAQNLDLNNRQIRTVRSLIEAHEHEIRAAWKRHFGG
jgi:hypothetical protein